MLVALKTHMSVNIQMSESSTSWVFLLVGDWSVGYGTVCYLLNIALVLNFTHCQPLCKQILDFQQQIQK